MRLQAVRMSEEGTLSVILQKKYSKLVEFEQQLVSSKLCMSKIFIYRGEFEI
jgi:hypothetical protein